MVGVDVLPSSRVKLKAFKEAVQSIRAVFACKICGDCVQQVLNGQIMNTLCPHGCCVVKRSWLY